MPAIGEGPERDIRHRELFAADVLSRLQINVENFSCLLSPDPGCIDRRFVPRLLRSSDQSEEHCNHAGQDMADLPIHPTLCVNPCSELTGVKASEAVLRTKVPHNGIGLPEYETIVLDRWNPSIRIHVKVLRRIKSSELAADLLLIKGNVQFVTAPKHLLDINRSVPSPNAQHLNLPDPGFQLHRALSD